MTLPFNPMNHPLSFAMPERLTTGTAWQEHIPFAMFLVSAHRPKFLVELGTYLGDSYCAFCQSIQALELNAQCYAVDTWQGDKHSGFYGEQILADLRDHHDPRYGGFSRLLRCTFDEALPHIPDGSADILHIDGLHTYESVRHDFESWLPKLSRRGIVLFHDTNVRESDFGVHQLWAELKTSYPSFEFLHGHGLGVLAVGEVQSPDLQALFKASPEEQTIIREFFFQLGRRLFMEGHVKRLESHRAQLENQIESQRHELTAQLHALITQLSETTQTLATTATKHEQAQQNQQAAEANANKLATQLDGLVNSRAWKLVELIWRIKRLLRS